MISDIKNSLHAVLTNLKETELLKELSEDEMNYLTTAELRDIELATEVYDVVNELIRKLDEKR